MIGDSTCDSRAAKAARMRSIGVLTGGFSEAELLEAGASKVFASVANLRSRLQETILRV
jgi:phosphoglycolate phosphatase-like HAD superfamily hydrolase